MDFLEVSLNMKRFTLNEVRAMGDIKIASNV